MGQKITTKRRRRSPRANRRRIDITVEALDYRNTEFLKKFMTERGKILPRRITGMPAKFHRKLTREIKRSRNILLIK